MKTVQRVCGDMALRVPANWVDQSVATYVGPPGESGFRSNIVAVSRAHPGKVDLAAFAQNQLPSLQELLPGFELIHHGPVLATDGRERYKLSYAFTHAAGEASLRLRQDQWYASHAHKILTLTLTTTAAEAEKMASVLDEIALTTDFIRT